VIIVERTRLLTYGALYAATTWLGKLERQDEEANASANEASVFKKVDSGSDSGPGAIQSSEKLEGAIEVSGAATGPA
jgi:hypothetical protein